MAAGASSILWIAGARLVKEDRSPGQAGAPASHSTHRGEAAAVPLSRSATTTGSDETADAEEGRSAGRRDDVDHERRGSLSGDEALGEQVLGARGLGILGGRAADSEPAHDGLHRAGHRDGDVTDRVGVDVDEEALAREVGVRAAAGAGGTVESGVLEGLGRSGLAEG